MIPTFSPLPARLALPCLVALGLLATTAAASGLNFSGKALSDIFWQLDYVSTPNTRSPSLGGQNFTTCCLKAVNEAIEVGPDGHLRFTGRHDDWITFSEGAGQPVDLLFNYSLRGQFPCTATYNGDPRGAPLVRVNYTWLVDTCPGWELSSKDNLNAWLQPLSGFLVPAVIFCLSIPRRRKLELPRFLFSRDQGGIKNYLYAPFGAVLALIMVCTDILIWLCICFAFAGPMIISGLYEAMLDNAVLDYLRLKIDADRLTLDMRCRCLMVILIGNLDLVWTTDGENGGHVDAGTHGGRYLGGNDDDGDDDDDENDALINGAQLYAGGGGDGSGGFGGRQDRESSGDVPLADIRRVGDYYAVPGAEQQFPPQGEYTPLAPHGYYAPPSANSPSSAHPPDPASPFADAGPSRPSVAQGAGIAAGSPALSGASLSPRSPAPVLPVSSGAAALQNVPLPPQGLLPITLGGDGGGSGVSSSLPLASPFWNQQSSDVAARGADGEQYGSVSDPNAAALQDFHGSGQQFAVPPPPPPAPQHGYGQEENTANAPIPGFRLSPASTGPAAHEPILNAFHILPSQQQPYAGHQVAGFPPPAGGPSHSVDYGVPQATGSHNSPSVPAQQLAAPGPTAIGTPYAGSGLVVAGVVAAGVGAGVSKDASQRLLVNHRNGGPLASPWQHMEEFLYPLRLYDDEFPQRMHSPRQYAKHAYCPMGKKCFDSSHKERVIPRTAETQRLINQIKTRLKTMLHCQYSFGSVVGAPVVFFLGGFIFALLQSLDSLGDEDIAEGLAFGQWYMTIPHIAIVSGLLLAGNNPNILEGVLAVDRQYKQDNIKFLGLTYGLSYPSCYKVASLWDRGYNKKQWLNTLCKTYEDQYDVDYYGNVQKDKDIVGLKKAITLSLSDWFLLLSLTLLLLGLPYILAFLTAYFTPEIGLSCRSLTLTIYLLVESCQILLWLWAYAGPLSDVESKSPGFFRSGGWLDRRGFYKPYSVRWLVDKGQVVPRNPFKLMRLVWNDPRRLLSWHFVWNLIYYPSQWVLGIIGIVATIGGTLMQLMGVYSADICYITTPFWFSPLDQRPMPVISTNSAEMIRQSELTWKPCAITAILFMSVVSFVGWWYQRRMRDLFTKQVLLIDENERWDTLASKPNHGRRSTSRVVSGGPPAMPNPNPNPNPTPTPTTPPQMSGAVPGPPGPQGAPRTVSGASAATSTYRYYQPGDISGRGYGSLGSMPATGAPQYAPGAPGPRASVGAGGRPASMGPWRDVSGTGSVPEGRTPSLGGAPAVDNPGSGVVSNTVPATAAAHPSGASIAAGAATAGAFAGPSVSTAAAAGDAGAAGPFGQQAYGWTPAPNAPMAEPG